jgi:hypothetical protein
MRFNEFKRQLTEGFDPQVLAMQKELKAAGADLGDFGPKHDGLDGMLGPYTRRAAKKFPEIAKQYSDVLKKPDAPMAFGNPRAVDISAIQDPDFNKKLELVAKELGVEASTLKAIIKNESRGNPAAFFQSKTSKFRAGGLIGFTEATAETLGTTLDDLLKMSAVDQLDYVYRYYKMVGVKPGMSRGDMYMLTFMPAYKNAPDDTVLGQQGGGKLPGTGLSMDKIWDQNPMFGKSRGKDHFTVADVKNTIDRVA